MRILSLIARLNVGGPARHVAVLDEGLKARGHTTLLGFGPVREGEGSLESLVEGLSVCRISELGRRIHPYDDLVAFLRIVWLMYRYRPDLLHTHTAKAGALGRLAAMVYNLTALGRPHVSVVHTFHGHVFEGYFGPVGDRAVRRAERMLARLTDRIIAISPLQRRDLVERFGIAGPSQVVVIPLGLDLDSLLAVTSSTPSLRSRLGIPEAAVVVGFVGRLVPVKDPFTLIDAFSRVIAAVPSAVLVVAGEGPLETELRQAVHSRGLDAHVRFAGWQLNLPSLYATCDIVVLTSRNEGTPMAVIEAMAAGRPVVATAVGGVPDLIESGRNGILVAAGAAADLADGVCRLARDQALREDMGQAARHLVASRFDRRRLVDDMERLYAEIAGTPNRTVDAGVTQ